MAGSFGTGKIRRVALLLALLLLVVCHAYAVVPCPSGCACLNGADAKAKGYTALCADRQTLCGYDANQNPMYCYVIPQTTTPPTVATPNPRCPSGCACLREADGEAKGFSRCAEERIPCGFDATQQPMYCFDTTVRVEASYAPCPADCACMDAAEAEGKGYSCCDGCRQPCGGTTDGAARYCFRKVERCPEGCECLDPFSAARAGYAELCGGDKSVCAIVDGAERYCYGKPPSKATAISAERTVVAPGAGVAACTLSGRITGFTHDPSSIRVSVQEMEYIPASCLATPPFTCFPGAYRPKSGAAPVILEATPAYAGDLPSFLAYRVSVDCFGTYQVRPVYHAGGDACEWEGSWEYAKSTPFVMNGSSEDAYDIRYVQPDNRVPDIGIAFGPPVPPAEHMGQGNWTINMRAQDPGGIRRISAGVNLTVEYYTSDGKVPLERVPVDVHLLYRVSCNESPCEFTVPYQPASRRMILDLEVSACDRAGNGVVRSYHREFPEGDGDLLIEGAAPVQVLYGAPLVRGKGTAFRVNVSSTFPYAVEAKLGLHLNPSE
ncbi:MAG: hypothetical protein QHG99_00090 [Methanomicrobiales archaeon]|nr:hypothetical protein [Methanomicrobiales archaeon]